jgi:hypothetical protein
VDTTPTNASAGATLTDLSGQSFSSASFTQKRATKRGLAATGLAHEPDRLTTRDLQVTPSKARSRNWSRDSPGAAARPAQP